MKKGQTLLKKVTCFLDEERNIYLPVQDRLQQFRKMSKPSSSKSFVQKRNEKRKLLRQEFRNPKSRLFHPPVPGGVGYGVYYKQNVQWSFSDFSCLDYCIVTPGTVGGDLSNFLYLTATNGTAMGVEALISYFRQDTPLFQIFDWSKPKASRWALSIDCRQIPQNFSTVSIESATHQFCRILNKTEQVHNGIWENKVYLFNFENDNWDNVYENQYEASLTQQKQVHAGSWGPIVETFQPDFAVDINPVGFFSCRLYNDRINTLLQSGNTVIRDDNDGLDFIFKDGNHSFLVT